MIRNGVLAVIQNYAWLHAAWLLPALALLYLYSQYRRDQALRRFVDAKLLPAVKISSSRARRWLKASLIGLALCAIAFALTRPGWGLKKTTVHRKGRDIVFIVDVSRSMLAEDLLPNRLERAKIAIRDLMDTLEGDRVGLVAFAGLSTVKCPLTLDYSFMRIALNDLGPESVSRGGTLIGDAVRKAQNDVFDKQVRDYKDVILITDGEDHDSFPVKASEKAGEENIRIFTVGLGDAGEGRRIPYTDENGQKRFVMYQGREVWTKLDEETLRKMALATGGSYLPVATGTIDLGDVYTNLISQGKKREVESQSIDRYHERYHYFIGLAVLLLFVEALISDRRKD